MSVMSVQLKKKKPHTHKYKPWEIPFQVSEILFNILHIGHSSNMDMAFRSDQTYLSINRVNRVGGESGQCKFR